MKKTAIKICGLTTKADIMAVNEANVEYAGFVIFKKSKRNVSFEKAWELMQGLKPEIQSVAVVVSPDEAMMEKLNAMPISIVQIHGETSEDIIKKSRHPVWQAVNMTYMQEATKQMLDLKQVTGYVLDAAVYGSGKTFVWEAEKAKTMRTFCNGKKVILAGGLCLDNVEEGIRLFAPDVVDVSSGVENEMGNGKDKEKILKFAGKVKNYE